MPTLTTSRARLLIALSRWRVQLGFSFAIAALLCARPTEYSYLTFLPLVLIGVTLRVWARGHLDRAERVCTGGPYGLMRHPLYVGSFLMGLGVTLMALPWGFVPLYSAVFLVMYVPKAIREETHLAGLFGDAYATYSNAVGAVFPHRKHATIPDPVPSRFEWSRVRRHREWHTWIGVAAVLAVVWLPSILWP